MVSVAGFILALAGIVTAVVTAVHLVAPELRPKEQLGATVEKIAITQDAAHVDDGVKLDPQMPGIEVLVRARLMAYQDRSYSVRLELHQANTMRRLDTVYSTCPLLSPTANEETATWKCWTAAPPSGTEYFARAILSDDGLTEDLGKDGNGREGILDFLDGPVLTVPD
ncbi:hypothetical protein D6T63_13895 [Arthrobacter cheniae]|uniref:Uncharacterized protein n=1 Tax=Arthrobacter cheniae TaxID=1258888 RepID=A0A3A5MBR8_9MICC|nr:hypothetical protein D6T63_13895 [Arthrobacter cheniae]